MPSVLDLKTAYKSRLTLFLESIGFKEAAFNPNMYAYMGRWEEETITNLLRAWDGNNTSLYQYVDPIKEALRDGMNPEQVAKKLGVRHVWQPNKWFRNPEFPWIVGDIDALIKNYPGYETESEIIEGFPDSTVPGEVKVVSGYVSRQWTTKIPPNYIGQLQTYAHLINAPGGVFSAKVTDNQSYLEVPIQATEGFAKVIIEEARLFKEAVLKGRKLMKKHKGAHDRLQALSDLLPDPGENFDSSLTMSIARAMEVEERAPLVAAEAGPEEDEMMAAYLQADLTKKKAVEEQKLLRIKLQRYMQTNSIEELIGDQGRYVRWRKKFSIKQKM